MTAGLPTLQELKCLYCRDAINHTKEECGDVISKKEVVKLLKAHAAAHEKNVAIWGNEPVTEVTSLRNVYYNLGRAEGARDAVLKLTDEITQKTWKWKNDSY